MVTPATPLATGATPGAGPSPGLALSAATLPWAAVLVDEQGLGLPAEVSTARLGLTEPGATTVHEAFVAATARWVCFEVTRQPAGGWVVYGQDITVQKQREQQYQALAENIPDVLTRWGPDLRLRYANAAFAAQTGQPLAAALGRTLPELGLPADVAEAYQAALQRTFATG